MTIDDIKKLIAEDEHRTLELKKSTGELKEGMCTGVRRMIDLCREQGLPEPEYQSDGYTVKIVFWKTTQKSESTTQNTTQKSKSTTQKAQKNAQKELEALLGDKIGLLSDKQLFILSQIFINPKRTRRELAENNKELTDDSVKHSIARLQELGLLRREGGRKNGEWIVTIKERN